MLNRTFSGAYREPRVAAERARILIVVINALRNVGEPATSGEIAEYARPRIATFLHPSLERDVADVLTRYSKPPEDPADTAPFQRVAGDDGDCWTFSAAFRDALSDSGLQVSPRTPETQ